MTQDKEPNEIQQMVNGFVLLMLFHILAGFIIFVLGLIIGMIFGSYSFLIVWFGGAMGLSFWQLFYVIPLSLRFKRRGKIGMMKGVIIGAVFTALINGACFLTLSR